MTDYFTQNNGRRLPEGIQFFDMIRREDYVYVDKTDLVWHLANGRMFNYLSRPRRFGKSLLVDTLRCYFEGCKELFEGLKINAATYAKIFARVLYFCYICTVFLRTEAKIIA